MLRLLWVIAFLVALGGSALLRPAQAQGPKAKATISALQTRVAELEEQLGLTPTPMAQQPESSSVASAPAVVGTALDRMPEGEPGKLSVIATGKFHEGSTPIVLRNNTGDDLTMIEVSGDVRNARGLVTQTINAGSQFKPNVVHPGQLVIGAIYLDQPVGRKDVVTLTARGSSDLSYYEYTGRESVPLELVEFNNLGDRVTGSVSNPARTTTTDNGYLQLMCFNASGFPLWTDSSYVNDGLAPGGIAAFEFGEFGGIPVDCGTYLFGAYSYVE